MERCPSGRRSTPGKRVYGQLYQGFKSLSLRQKKPREINVSRGFCFLWFEGKMAIFLFGDIIWTQKVGLKQISKMKEGVLCRKRISGSRRKRLFP